MPGADTTVAGPRFNARVEMAATFMSVCLLRRGTRRDFALPTTCGRYPQQHQDFSSGLAPAGADRNFCRHWSLQKQNVCPFRSAWRAIASTTVIPQMESLVTDFESFMVRFASRVVHFTCVSRTHDYFLDSLATTTTSKTTTTTPIIAQSHIPPPTHPPIHPLLWFIIKPLSLRYDRPQPSNSDPKRAQQY